MFLDNETLFADDLPFGTPDGAEIDLGSVRPGPGNPIKCFLTVSADMTGMTGVSVKDAAVSPADEALLTVTEDTAGQTIEFELPSNTQRFVTVSLAGTLGVGTWSCGIVLPGVQTNT